MLVIDKVLSFLKGRRNGQDQACASTNTLAEIKATVDKTWKMHDQYDEDGAPKVFTPRSWVATQKDIASAVERVSVSQEKLVKGQEDMARSMERLADKLNT